MSGKPILETSFERSLFASRSPVAPMHGVPGASLAGMGRPGARSRK